MTSSRGQGPDGHAGRDAPPETSPSPSDGGQDPAARHAELVRAVRTTAERIERNRLAEAATRTTDAAPTAPSRPPRSSRPETAAADPRSGGTRDRRTGRRVVLLAALFVALLSVAGLAAFVIGAGSGNQAVVGDV